MDRPKPLLEVLHGQRQQRPPIWMMRQAGRYLPEYRELRARAGSFLKLCFTPEFAAEVTLQPIRRFGFDAAIIFSDILVIPHALGQTLTFTEGEGPKLTPPVTAENIDRLRGDADPARLAPIYETIRLARAGLAPNVTLLGFCGAPWTVATYMVAGEGTSDQAPARLMAYRDPAAFQRLIDVLVEASIDYLAGQFAAGVDAVQIFDTWAGSLPPDEFARWCIAPTLKIITGLRTRVPDAPVIGFPRGAGTNLVGYTSDVPVNAIGLDWTVDLAHVRDVIQPRRPVQGNLDPLALLAGGDALDRGIDAILGTLSQGPFIFNLGHGILPATPIAHVERMLKLVQG